MCDCVEEPSRDVPSFSNISPPRCVGATVKTNPFVTQVSLTVWKSSPVARIDLKAILPVVAQTVSLGEVVRR